MRISKLLLAPALLLLAGAPLAADVAGRRTIDLPSLLDLPGDFAFVRYAPGSLDRAAAIQQRFEPLSHEFQRSGFAATTMVLYSLSREDWQAAGLTQSYGLPETIGLDGLALPGWADERVVEIYRQLLAGALPMPIHHPILISPEESAALTVADLLAELDAARILVRRTGLVVERPWLEPFAAHLAARMTWDKYEPGRIGEIAAIFDHLALSAPEPGNLRRLEDWSDHLSFAEQRWYDARFLRAVDQLVTVRSQGSLWRMLGKAFSGKEPLSEAELFKKFKGLVGWKATSFAP